MKESLFPIHHLERSTASTLNCYAFVFSQLGIDPYEAVGGLNTTLVEDYFVVLDTMDSADAIAMRIKNRHGYDHMVYVDQSAKGAISHVENNSGPIQSVSIEQLREHYPALKYDFIFLQKKSRAPGA